MKTRLSFIAAILPVAVLAACGDNGATEEADGAASGEVLEGTISDEMLPIDRTKSQPPLVQSQQSGDAEGDGSAPSAGQGDPAQPAPETTQPPDILPEDMPAE